MFRISKIWIVIIAWVMLPSLVVAADVYLRPHVRVDHEGLSREYVEAMAEIVALARKIYIERFGFKMPETITLQVRIKAGNPSRLFTDGWDRVFLSHPNAEKLRSPAKSGTYNIYGLCHELGHIAMYRILKRRDWMTTAAAEGWAHYTGSVVVDHVFKAKGAGLWPDRYKYKMDGTLRLRKQLRSPKPSEISQGAGHWLQFASIIGEKGFIKLFDAWQNEDVDLEKPAVALEGIAMKIFPQRKKEIASAWRSAADLFTKKRVASTIQNQSVDKNRLSGKPIVLAGDDGTSDGRHSLAGGGHARFFAAPMGGDSFLQRVSIFGSRYGASKAPNESFEIALCDKHLKPIAVWRKAYSKIPKGKMKWHTLDVVATKVPKQFYVCLKFNPTASNGVYVGLDTSTKGSSRSAVPGRHGKPLLHGDWMIRAQVDRLKAKDALQQQ